MKNESYFVKKNHLPSIEDVLNHEYVFILSTGRCGTALITKILDCSDQLLVYHDPIPVLEYASSCAAQGEITVEAKKFAILASRFDHMFAKAKQEGKIYVETNCRITFFAKALSELLPNSKFVHLVRDPRDFVTSGMNRQYYVQGSIQYQRLSFDIETWREFNQLQKITTEWNVINGFIEKFKGDLTQERIITLKCEDIFRDFNASKELLNFISPNLDIPDEFIEQNLMKKINKNTCDDFPKFSKWRKSEVSSFDDVINKDLIRSYNY